MFCKEIKSTYDLSEEIEDAYEFIEGDFVSYRKILASTEEKIRNGKFTLLEAETIIYGVTTNTEKEYRILTLIYSKDSDLEGLDQIRIIDEDKFEAYLENDEEGVVYAYDIG